MSFRDWLRNLVLLCFGSPTAFELPDSVIHEILMKLPIKSIVRCRGVCKGWYQLIMDPYFAKVYFKTSTSNDIAITQHLWQYHQWTSSKPEDENGFLCYLETGRNGDVTRKPLNLKASTTKKNTSLWYLLGSCDGLLCLLENPPKGYFSTTNTVCVVNLLIGEYIVLPKDHREYNADVVYGFGSTGDHYKVVKVVMKHSGNLGKRILTVGVDTNWRVVESCSWPLHSCSDGVAFNCENCVPPLRLKSTGVALNGILHWLGDSDNVFTTNYTVIYAFDILKEKGQCFKLPFAVGRKASMFYLGTWNGNLCVIDNTDELQVDIWTMKQYGVVGSWSKDIVLKSSVRKRFQGHVIPITTMRNGNLMISCSDTSRLYSFDPKTKNCVELHIDPNGSPKIVTGYGYTPSFISPHNL